VLMVGQPDCPFIARAASEGIPAKAIRMRGEADPLAVASLARLMKHYRPDIVHMHTSHAHTLGVVASRLSGWGKTIVSRRVDFSIHRTRLKANILKYRFGVDRYIAISEGVRQVLVKDGIPAERIEIVPSGVDVAALRETPHRDFREEFGIPTDAPIVGDVAHFGWHKAQEELVAACPLIWERVPEARVLLVGDGECRPKVMAAARELGLDDDDRLIFTGHRTDARELVRWFDVFVMCSVLEGLCTSILDAHVLGTPVVASRVGGIPEAVAGGRAGLLVPPRDPRALASGIVSLLTDRKLAEEFIREGRARVDEQFSVDVMVNGTRNVYERVLGRVAG